jgi:hypothetical protein
MYNSVSFVFFVVKKNDFKYNVQGVDDGDTYKTTLTDKICRK